MNYSTAEKKPVMTGRVRGFTLIELMVVVLIVAVLAGIAYPSYTQYVIRARRADGQSALLQLQGQQEKFLTQCGKYTNQLATGTVSACTGLGYPNTLADSTKIQSPDRNYNLYISTIAANAATYTATAEPVGAQANDTDCAKLTLTSTGVKGQTGPNVQQKCWQK